MNAFASTVAPKASSNDAFVGKLGRARNYLMVTWKLPRPVDLSLDSSGFSCDLCTYGSYKPPELLAYLVREWSVA